LSSQREEEKTARKGTRQLRHGGRASKATWSTVSPMGPTDQSARPLPTYGPLRSALRRGLLTLTDRRTAARGSTGQCGRRARPSSWRVSRIIPGTPWRGAAKDLPAGDRKLGASDDCNWGHRPAPRFPPLIHAPPACHSFISSARIPCSRSKSGPAIRGVDEQVANCIASICPSLFSPLYCSYTTSLGW
jgi:hypothetical protein